MRHFLIPLTVVSFLIVSLARGLTAEEKVYYVVVYGGTSAAVIAAQPTALMGKSVIVVSPDKHLGGLSSGGLGATDSGKQDAIGGLAKGFYHRLWQHYQADDAWTFEPKPEAMEGQGGRGINNTTQTMWVFEPSAAEGVFESIVQEHQIEVLREERLDRENGVEKQGNLIESITTLSGKTFRGRMFIDATYEGDLMAAAGVTYTVGRESNDAYGETLNGVQVGMSRYHQFAGFVDPYVERGNPESGLLPGVHPEINGPDGSADELVQAYNLRVCMTDLPENRLDWEKPQGYDELQYELLFRSIEAGQTEFTTFSRMPNRKTDSNNNFAVSTDFIGQNYDYPDASYQRRAEIYQEHLRWHQGLFWTLANHERVPEEIRQVFQKWGRARDEFQENGGWSWQMYIRESRRMVGDFVVTQNHLQRKTETPRPIGMGSYQMDSHNTQRYVARTEDGRATVRNEGDVEVGLSQPYPIDYGAILPKKAECANLLDPVTVSTTHIAYGSIRMEPVFMILGQSAATAAVLSIEAGCAPQDLPYETLRARLESDGQRLVWDK